MSYHGPSYVPRFFGAVDAPARTEGHYLMRPGSVPPAYVAPNLAGYGGAGGLGVAKEALKRAQREAQVVKAAARVQSARSRLPAKLPTPAPTSVRKDAQGRVVVPTSSFWSQWNGVAAGFLQPLAGVIDSLPREVLTATGKAQLKSRPLDTILDIFDPIEDRVGAAVDRVIAQKGNVQNFFGKRVNIQRVQAADKRADVSTQNLLKRLRTIQAFCVLYFTQPIELHVEMAVEGFDMMKDAVTWAGKTAENIAKATGEAVDTAVKAGQNAIDEVASWLGLGGLGGLGGAGLGEPVTAATAAGTAAGAEAVTGILGAEIGSFTIVAVETIMSIVTAVTGLTSAGAGLVEATGFSLKPPTVSRDRPSLPKGGSRPPTITPPPSPGFRPPGPAVPPPTKVSSGESSILPVVAFAGAAVLAVVLLKKK